MEELKKIDPNSYLHISNSSPWLEIRLFYVRITPCVTDTAPDHLTLRHLRRKLSTPLEINGSRIPSSDSALVVLRRDRVNKESSEVTYVSTDSVRVTGAVEFEVLESNDMILCGSLERVDRAWGNGSVGLESDGNGTGWSVECYVAACVLEGRSSFFKASCIEFYIAGCCGDVPVILTKTISISPRRKGTRQGMLDSIPEDEELEKDGNYGSGNGLVRRRKSLMGDSDSEDYELDEKLGNRHYLEDRYYDEDGQLSWFNAGVRVGVGIGLGMCVGVGLGVGLLMHSYQTATRNFRRTFF